MTPLPQGMLCTPTALDPSLHAQPVNYSLGTHAVTEPETISSVLDPSSHEENVDLAFSETVGLHNSATVENSGCSQPLDAFSSFDPSSHAQNVHFTTLDPSEHVQTCAIGPLTRCFTPLIPAAADASLQQQNTTYPVMNTRSYDTSTFVQLAAHQSQLRPQNFVLPEHSDDQHIHSMEYMEYVVPEIESQPRQMNTPNDIGRLTCSQPTGASRLGYQLNNFMVTA